MMMRFRSFSALAFAAFCVSWAPASNAKTMDAAEAVIAASATATTKLTAGLDVLLQKAEIRGDTAAGRASTPTTLSVIARPTLSDALDTALDVNNNEGTMTLTIAPFLLGDPWADYRWANTKFTVALNSGNGDLTGGLRWDFTQKDPRFYFRHFASPEVVAAKIQQARAPCESMPANSDAAFECGVKAIDDVVDAELKKAKEGKLGTSISGNVTYNDGAYRGSTASGAVEWVFNRSAESLWQFPLTANVLWEDQPPVDGEAAERNRQVGGGLEIAANRSFDESTKSFGLGFAAVVLECVESNCTNDKATLRLNPHIGVALSDSVGARVDFVWEGDGGDLRNAVAGLKFDYKFSKLGGD